MGSQNNASCIAKHTSKNVTAITLALVQTVPVLWRSRRYLRVWRKIDEVKYGRRPNIDSVAIHKNTHLPLSVTYLAFAANATRKASSKGEEFFLSNRLSTVLKRLTFKVGASAA